ncbi:hypothetical protein E1292_38390 [Nonomuraea deserti]|uniref:Aminoglycoside phosphotransferase domain-containing protein n=1 Tax=Nonomuraea deserti TaxID=1848322 RepID=A0A4R4VAF8_9ACTN|nr:hypothetical protein [Nonomuraea deserti]TDC96449.1 hypothetical protein E1292_38390 [Nonomuraea deserti]
MRVALEGYVGRVLGVSHVEREVSWEHGATCVLRVRDRAGRTWYAKRHRRKDGYARETFAYRHWVPVLGGHAPRLRACDDELQALVLSAVPGTHAQDVGAEGHHQAGVLLRRFHEAAPPEPCEGFAAARRARLEHWVPRCAGVIERGELDFVRSRVRELDGLPRPARVPCHLDYTPRNWLTGEGRLHVVDFEWAATEVWINDLARLSFGVWRERPWLGEAFLDGYGRRPTADELALQASCYALTAMWMMIWAREHGEAAFEAGLRDQLRFLMRSS